MRICCFSLSFDISPLGNCDGHFVNPNPGSLTLLIKDANSGLSAHVEWFKLNISLLKFCPECLLMRTCAGENTLVMSEKKVYWYIKESELFCIQAMSLNPLLFFMDSYFSCCNIVGASIFSKSQKCPPANTFKRFITHSKCCTQLVPLSQESQLFKMYVM